MEREDIKELILSHSPWLGGNVQVIEKVLQGMEMTNMISYFLSNVKQGKVSVVTGPRNVGKTVALFFLIRQNINDMPVLFINLDNLPISPQDLEKIAHVFVEEFVGERWSTLNSDVLLIFDEIQHIENWSRAMKSLLDTNYTKKARIVVSGSSPRKISMESDRVLAHRAEIFLFYPLKFSEFLNFWLNRRGKRQIAPIKNVFDLVMKSPGAAFKMLENYRSSIYDLIPSIKKALTEYARKGGFPFIVFEKGNIDEFGKMLNEIKSKDLGIRSDLFWAFLRNLCDESPEKKMKTLASALGDEKSKRDTVERWLNGLYGERLIDIIHPRFTNLRKVSRTASKRFKIFFCDRGLKNYICSGFSPLFDSINKGIDAEAMVFNVVMRWLYKKHPYDYESRIFYIPGEPEVDFVIETDKRLLIESKMKKRKKIEEYISRVRDVDALKNLPLIVVSEDEFFTYNGALVVPLWLFSLFV